jgi:polysaccharide export outer membrane protein
MNNPFISAILISSLSLFTWAQAARPNPDTAEAAIRAQCLKNPAAPICSERAAATPDQILVNETAPVPAETSPSRPPEVDTPTEFQKFVADGTGGDLPIFGHLLFEQVPSTFAPLDKVGVPSTYVLGPGDELVIRAWGQIDVDARVTVDRTGAIYLPRVGSLMVTGLQYQQLPQFLKSSIGRIYRNFDLVVTLGQLRSIQVFILGHARRPGMYTVSSLSTLVNALFASGGPSNRGSMRRIELKRDGRVISTFDIYDLLLKGDKSRDVVLMSGDVIYVSSVGPQVALVGSVNAPGIYELSGSTSLMTQIEAAGGLTSVADGDRAIVERIENHSTRRVEEFRLDAAGLNRELHDGDVVRLFTISPKIENAVTLRGNIARPGRYPWREGMRIRDLIPSREFLLTSEFWQQQNTKDAASPQKGTEELRNEVKRSAPELNWEYAVIQRMDRTTLASHLISFNLENAMDARNETDNMALEPGDILTIFSQSDIAVPLEKRSKYVRLEGEFRAPGVYRVQPNESLKTIIQRAGGMTERAYRFGAVFTRESARIEQQKSLEEMVRNLEMAQQRNSLTNAQRSDQNAATLQAQSDHALIEKIRTLKATGRVVLESRFTGSGESPIPDMQLEDGDRLYIPPESSTVTVIGSVYNPNSFVFKTNTRLGKYLEMAGSGTRDADTKHAFVVRADGSVVSKENSSSWGGGVRALKSLPGDMLVVPPQTEKGAFFRGLKDWSQVISQFGLGAAAAFVFTK